MTINPGKVGVESLKKINRLAAKTAVRKKAVETMKKEEGIMPYKEEVDLEKKPKSKKFPEPQRKDYPKGKLGDAAYRKAYKEWLVKIT